VTREKPPPASATDRQRRYRTTKGLRSIDVSAEVLATLKILRSRLGQPTDVILKRALEALDAHLNPASVEEYRKLGRTYYLLRLRFFTNTRPTAVQHQQVRLNRHRVIQRPNYRGAPNENFRQ
jgi:MoxR-like ATPase